MNVRAARRIVFGLLGMYAVFLTWPGVVPFNRIRPLVFGLPFIMFWIVLWVLLVGAGFVLLNAAETRAESRAQTRAASGAASGAATGAQPRGKEGA
jgi:membrane protein required for beta-lactamase induction